MISLTIGCCNPCASDWAERGDRLGSSPGYVNEVEMPWESNTLLYNYYREK